MKTYAELRQHAGNAALFRAAQLSLIGAIRGCPLHLHAQGVRGTGKTTLLRAAATLLPPIVRIEGCLYNCDPRAPHCPEHREADEAALRRGETVPGPFLELSHSTKVATAVGSIDLSRLVGVVDPAAALLPGIIPQAHRGIVFIDEINRLADTAPELTDILLDVMGTKPGRLQVEESGLPVATLTTVTTVWAASNPDEDPGPLAEIRRQLSDRFDLVVTVERPQEAGVVQEIIAEQVRSLAEPSGEAGLAAGEASRHLAAAREALLQAAARVPQVVLPEALSQLIASVYLQYGIESLRAAEGLALASVFNCALRGGATVERSDLATVAPLVLAHRLDAETLAAILDHLAGGPSLPKGASGARGGQNKGGRGASRAGGGVFGLRRARLLRDLDPFEAWRPENELK